MGNYDGHKWIKVKQHKFDPNKSWKENYRALEAHHIAETTFLIDEVRKLDKVTFDKCYIPAKIRSRKFSKALITEYGEQTYRDHKRAGLSMEDAAWSSVYVAQGVGQIEEKDEQDFHKVIVRYATESIFPINFS